MSWQITETEPKTGFFTNHTETAVVTRCNRNRTVTGFLKTLKTKTATELIEIVKPVVSYSELFEPEIFIISRKQLLVMT